MAPLRADRFAELGNGFGEELVFAIGLGRDGDDCFRKRLRFLTLDGL